MFGVQHIDTITSAVGAAIQAETDKIDNAATDGLAGTSNSLSYRTAEVERHAHSGGRWFETAATLSGETHVADEIGSGGGAFQIDAGNDDWGPWLQVIGSSDTPVDAGKAFFDPHLVIVEDTEKAATYFIQLARGDSGAAGLAAGTYTDLPPYIATVQKETGPIITQSGRAPAGSKVWARCKCPGENTGTLDFYLGIHEYEG